MNRILLIAPFLLSTASAQTFNFNAFAFNGGADILAHDVAGSAGSQISTVTTSFVDNGNTVNATLSIGNSSNPTNTGLERLGGTFGIGNPEVIGIADTEFANEESIVFTFSQDVYLSEFIFGVPNANSGVLVTINGVETGFGELYDGIPNGGPASRVFTFAPELVPAGTDLIFQVNQSTVPGNTFIGTVGNLQLTTVIPEPSTTMMSLFGLLGLTFRRQRSQ